MKLKETRISDQSKFQTDALFRDVLAKKYSNLKIDLSHR